MADERLVERLWYGDGARAAMLRTALLPAEALFRGAVAVRGWLYAAGVLRQQATVLPAVSVGNLTVGGTGKTPVAAWLARRLHERGASPAIVLRGYGGDEPEVHRILNPELPVVIAADRVAGVRAARVRGADVAILDDAFQHRRAARIADVVLVSADRWTGSTHLLPVGPWREPLAAAGRASLLVVVRKAATDEVMRRVDEALASVAPGIPRAHVALAPNELVEYGGTGHLPIDALAGASVHALLGIADPAAFVRQLQHLGARVSAQCFPDHHAFSDEEIRAFAASTVAGDLAVCTLKDAVKVGERWPREAPPLWYVSQHVIVERGADELEQVVRNVIHARDRLTQTAG